MGVSSATSGAKALEILPLYGTAEGVPYPNPCYQSFLLIICTRHVVTRAAFCGTAEAGALSKRSALKHFA